MVKGQSLFTGGGGEGRATIFGERVTVFGRALFKKHSLRGGLRVLEIISIYYQSLNSEISSFGSLYLVDFNLSLVAA